MREKIWNIFLILLAAVAISYTSPLAYRLYLFFRMSQSVSPHEISWNVKKLSDEKYVPEAQYSFTYNNEHYNGQFPFEEISYRNQWAAQKAMEDLKKQHQTIWFSSSSPHFSVLEKKIPLKQSIYSFTLIGIFVYFLFLRYYVKNHKGDTGV